VLLRKHLPPGSSTVRPAVSCPPNPSKSTLAVPQPSKRSAKSASRAKDPSDEIAGVRIIGGSLRGRLLQYSGDMRTRPMKDRVRESVFNLIGPAAAGTHAIDLFAGTGALGLEAVSRGATSATFIERHYPTSQLLKQNAAALGIEGQCEVVFGDAFLWARKAAEGRHSKSDNRQPKSESGLRQASRWLVFCSPPYDFYVSRVAEMLQLIASLWAAAPAGSLFVVESDERFEFGLLPEPSQWDVRDYRPAKVGLAAKQGS
jgi:16S rRNA (guanine966-N2)-methyltransferase